MSLHLNLMEFNLMLNFELFLQDNLLCIFLSLEFLIWRIFGLFHFLLKALRGVDFGVDFLLLFVRGAFFAKVVVLTFSYYAETVKSPILIRLLVRVAINTELFTGLASRN